MWKRDEEFVNEMKIEAKKKRFVSIFERAAGQIEINTEQNSSNDNELTQIQFLFSLVIRRQCT